MKYLIIFFLCITFSLQAVVINEFLAANETILADEWGEYDDWLELYNTSSSTIDLSGYYLSDDPDTLSMWQFPSGITIAADEYLIVWLDGDGAAQGPLHTNFRLSASGESIIISDPDLSIIDSYTFGPQSVDISMGRYPNGSGDFIYMAPTPGQSNNKYLVINEFLASNETILADEWGEYDDWLELYNNSENLIDLSGYYLSDDPEMLDRWQFPNGITIGAEEYLLIWLDGDGAAQGPLHTNFRLSASGESIIISDPDLNIVDAYTFGEQTTDISMGRYPNAIGPFYFMTPTPLASNLPGLQNDPELPAPQIFLTNYPNPFNPSTTISFNATETYQFAMIEIFNLKGQKIKTLPVTTSPSLPASVIWNGTDQNNQLVSAGLYFYKLNIPNSPVGKMMLVK